MRSEGFRRVLYAGSLVSAAAGGLILLGGTAWISAGASVLALDGLGGAVRLSVLGLALVSGGALVAGFVRFGGTGALLAIGVTFLAVGAAALGDAWGMREGVAYAAEVGGREGSMEVMELRAWASALTGGGIMGVALGVAALGAFLGWKLRSLADREGVSRD